MSTARQEPFSAPTILLAHSFLQPLPSERNNQFRARDTAHEPLQPGLDRLESLAGDFDSCGQLKLSPSEQVRQRDIDVLTIRLGGDIRRHGDAMRDTGRDGSRIDILAREELGEELVRAREQVEQVGLDGDGVDDVENGVDAISSRGGAADGVEDVGRFRVEGAGGAEEVDDAGVVRGRAGGEDGRCGGESKAEEGDGGGADGGAAAQDLYVDEWSDD